MSNRMMVALFLMCIFGYSLSGCGGAPKQADKLIAEGQYDRAIEIMEKYVKEHPDDHIGFMVLGDAYVGKARSIGGYGFNRATMPIVIKGTNYYKKSYEIKRTRLVEDKLAIASGMLEAP